MKQDELMHFGVKGMKWGKRKDNYSRGTSFGYRHYTKAANSAQRDADNLRKNGYKEEAKAVQKVADKNRVKAQAYQNKHDTKQEQKQNLTPEQKAAKTKKAIIIGSTVTATALATYGAYKVNQFAKQGLTKKYYDIGRDFLADRKTITANWYFDKSKSGAFTTKEKYNYVSDAVKRYVSSKK